MSVERWRGREEEKDKLASYSDCSGGQCGVKYFIIYIFRNFKKYSNDVINSVAAVRLGDSVHIDSEPGGF